MAHLPSGRLKFYSRNIFSQEQTSIQGLEYRANRWLKLTSSAGMGAGEPYGAIGAIADFEQFSVKAAYILQGKNFRRVQFDGNMTGSFGGNLIGNCLSVGLEYQTIYVPYVPSKPFTQAAVINIRFRPFGNVELNGGTTLGADGRVRYTAWGNDLMVRNQRYQQTPDAMAIPKYIIRGHMTDETGKPIRGAALRIGKELVFTDSNGLFFVRVSKPTGVPFEVAFDEFLAPGNWEKVTAPERANPELEEHALELAVVLRRHSLLASHQPGLIQEETRSLGSGD